MVIFRSLKHINVGPAGWLRVKDAKSDKSFNLVVQGKIQNLQSSDPTLRRRKQLRWICRTHVIGEKCVIF